MRHLYSFVMYLLTPFLLLRLGWKSIKLPAYRERIAERFCWDNAMPKHYDVWVHAVSLGEVIAVTPLVHKLLDKQLKVLVTTMTPTGAAKIKQQFGDQLDHRYVPYDLPSVLRRFFTANSIRLGLIVETELWPNLIFQATEFKIPLLLINARLSERSCRGYKKIQFIIKPTLNLFKNIYAQNAADAARFINLGAAPEKVKVLGNVKFDLNTQDVDKEKFQRVKQCWGAERTVLILGSTHDDEEQQILTHAAKLQQAIPNIVILIAARHPERFQKVYRLCKQLGFNTGLRSDETTLSPQNNIVILDSLGELLGWYSVSDYAFVGGSLVPVGGHNVLEPIAMHVPVVSGHHIHNFKGICEELKAANALEIIHNGEALVDTIIRLHNDPTSKEAQINAATNILQANKGAVQMYMDKVEASLS